MDDKCSAALPPMRGMNTQLVKPQIFSSYLSQNLLPLDVLTAGSLPVIPPVGAAEEEVTNPDGHALDVLRLFDLLCLRASFLKTANRIAIQRNAWSGLF